MSKDEIAILYNATKERIELAQDRIMRAKGEILNANKVISRETKILDDMLKLKDEYRAKLLLTIEDKKGD